MRSHGYRAYGVSLLAALAVALPGVLLAQQSAGKDGVTKKEALKVTAQQVLENNPNDKNTKFYAPPGKALKNGDVVQGKAP